MNFMARAAENASEALAHTIQGIPIQDAACRDRERKFPPLLTGQQRGVPAHAIAGAASPLPRFLLLAKRSSR